MGFLSEQEAAEEHEKRDGRGNMVPYGGRIHKNVGNNLDFAVVFPRAGHGGRQSTNDFK